MDIKWECHLPAAALFEWANLYAHSNILSPDELIKVM